MNAGRVVLSCILGGGIAVFGGVQAFDDETERDEAGQITGAGGLGVFAVKLGDCIELPDAELAVSVKGVPCDAPHDAEVYAKFDLAERASYDRTSVESLALEGCVDRWPAAIGTEYANDSELDVTAMFPTPLGWTGGDREVACLVMSIDESPLVGSRRVP